VAGGEPIEQARDQNRPPWNVKALSRADAPHDSVEFDTIVLDLDLTAQHAAL